MTQFDDRLEGEMKTHEKEMLRKAIITKYGGKVLAERIQYVLSVYTHEDWTDEKMFAKLTELGLIGKDTLPDVVNAFKDRPSS